MLKVGVGLALATALIFHSRKNKHDKRSGSKDEEGKKGAVTTIPEDVGLSSDRLSRLSGWLDGMVKEGRIPCGVIAVARHGKVAFLHTTGHSDLENGRRVKDDDIFRIHSMTKPITSVALCMLLEQGKFLLDEPIYGAIPEFKNLQVLKSDGGLEPAKPVTYRHVLTHTAGFTYGFFHANAVDALYRQHDIDFFHASSNEMVARLAKLPLLFQPGEKWNYGVSTDVAGVLVERLSGMTLDAFFQKHIFTPLGMKDTGFMVPAQSVSRFAHLYARAPPTSTSTQPRLVRMDPPCAELKDVPCMLRNDCSDSTCMHNHPDGRVNSVQGNLPSPFTLPPRGLNGGGGLVSTLHDYMRFCLMILGHGELDGVRILGRKTLDVMISDHMPRDLEAHGNKQFSESTYTAMGFGLGWAVVHGYPKNSSSLSEGSFLWGGISSTHFFIDPKEDLCCVFMTQLFPSIANLTLRSVLQNLVMQSLV